MPDTAAPQPRRNPVPREQRRCSVDNATSQEWAHYEHRKTSKLSFLSCWYCWHEPAEHLEHDWLVDGCPDCAQDAMAA